MPRTEMIKMLLDNLYRMNECRIASGDENYDSIRAFVAEERERYEKMSDMQLRNLIVINF